MSDREDPQEPPAPQPKYNWMNRSRQWGVRVRPGKAGLTLDSLNVGVYGEIPSRWDDPNRNPRGAIPARGALPVGYSIKEKSQLWAPSAAMLYEEAIQRRWSPATDVPWESISPLPNDIERAVCQIHTELSQFANIDVEVVTSWQHQMSYGYHEVKEFLATASLDSARRFEAFRKRALVNGGGLGVEGPGQLNRLLLESRGGWSETVAAWALVRGLFVQTTLRYLDQHAFSEAEQVIYRNVLQDVSRVVYYGLDHLKYAVNQSDTASQTCAGMLGSAVGMLMRDLRDPALSEALAIVFGKGIKGARQKGMKTFLDLVEQFASAQMEACTWLGFPRFAETIPERIRERLARKSRP